MFFNITETLIKLNIKMLKVKILCGEKEKIKKKSYANLKFIILDIPILFSL